MRSLCRDCGAPIIWCVTDKGRRMPVNADLSDVGNVFVYRGQKGLVAQVLSGEKLDGARLNGAALRTSHFMDCPAAAERRRRS